MSHYVIINTNNEVLRGGEYKSADHARSVLHPNRPRTIVPEHLYLRVNEPLRVPPREEFEFTYFTDLFGHEVSLRVVYIWADLGNGVAPVHAYGPEILHVYFDTVDLLPSILPSVLSDISREAREHYLSTI